VAYTVTDACDAAPTVTVDPSDPIGPPLAVGLLTITVTATDASGNIGSASVTVTVNPIEATFDFDPNTLNIANANGRVTGHIQLPPGCGTCEQIDLLSIALEGPLGMASPITDPKFGFVTAPCVDEDGDGVLEYLVKFERADVVIIAEEPTSLLTISGHLLASSSFGTAAFEGTDEIRVIQKGKKGKAAKLVARRADIYELSQNRPNPFNPTTKIAFQLPEAGEVSLVIYNLQGQLIRVLVQDVHAAGSYQVEWNGRDEGGRAVSSGVYFYRFVSPGLVQTKRMLLLK